jgi:hypothetical protein
MRKLVRLVLLAAMCISATTCALMTETRYDGPAVRVPDNSTVFPNSFETVWASAIASLTEKSFVLDTLSKDSRIITFSFSSLDPGEYLDCGQLTYINTGGIDGNGAKSIPGTAPMAELLVSTGMPRPAPARRTARLEGKANIIFSEEETRKTRVTVLARYVMSVRTETVAPGKVPYQKQGSVTLTTGQEGMHDGDEMTKCVSRYVLERTILDDISEKLQ